MTQTQKHGFGKTDALLLLMALIWGVNFSIVKFGTRVFSPLAFAGLRVILAAVVLLGISAARNKPWPRRNEIFALMGLGMIGNGLYQ
ncbi:MAG TPA: EamA family transporter, partial [Gemmatimonadaceae bacterium]|nr:EamA family transporter [Gemmatimonadaceae bacterium]